MGIDIAKSTRTARFVDAADYLLSLPPVERPVAVEPLPAPVVVPPPTRPPARIPEAVVDDGDAEERSGGVGTFAVAGMAGLLLLGFGWIGHAAFQGAETPAPVAEAPAVPAPAASDPVPGSAASSGGYFYDKVRVDRIAANLKVETDRAAALAASLPEARGAEASARFAALAQGVRNDVVAYRLDSATRGVGALRTAIAEETAPVPTPAPSVPAPVAATAPAAAPEGYFYDRGRIAALGSALKVETATARTVAAVLPDGAARLALVEEAASGIRRSIVDNRLDAASDALGALRADVAGMRNAAALSAVSVPAAAPSATVVPGVFSSMAEAVLRSAPDTATARDTALVAARLAAPGSVPAGEYGREEAWSSFADWQSYLGARIEIFAGVPTGAGEIGAAVSGAPGRGLPAETPGGMSVRTERLKLFFGSGGLPSPGTVVARKAPGSAVFEWDGGAVPEVRRADVGATEILRLPGDPAWVGVSYTVKGY